MSTGRSPLPALLSALPDFALAGLFLATWIAPDLLGTGRIGQLMLVMLLEFIVVHSAAFMGMAAVGGTTTWHKIRAILGFGVFYTLFVGGFALAFGVLWPLAAFWGLTLNRLLSAILGQAAEGDERQLMMRGWAVGALAYLAAVFATTLLPVPRLGITSEVVTAAALPGSGLWISEPWRVLAAGFLYFSAVGLSELVDHRWLPAAPPPA